jgi:hypothetical protein
MKAQHAEKLIETGAEPPVARPCRHPIRAPSSHWRPGHPLACVRLRSHAVIPQITAWLVERKLDEQNRSGRRDRHDGERLDASRLQDEYTVDLDTGVIVAAPIHEADKSARKHFRDHVAMWDACLGAPRHERSRVRRSWRVSASTAATHVNRSTAAPARRFAFAAWRRCSRGRRDCSARSCSTRSSPAARREPMDSRGVLALGWKHAAPGADVARAAQ